MKNSKTFKDVHLQVILAILLMIFSSASSKAATQQDIAGPFGSGGFGTKVSALPNGNIVVTDPIYDITTPSTITDVGAVYLYNGANGALISMITGSKKNDRIGSNGIIVLSSGNYLISSPQWDNNSAVDAGAVTFGDSLTGANGIVSDANSLVGSYSYDAVGTRTPKILANGDYLLINPTWNSSRGAVTWGNSQTGVTGTISASNSLIGSNNAGEGVGTGSNGNVDVTELPNGNYVVVSSSWNSNRGAVTLCKGSRICNGEVSASNSLVGSGTSDSVGTGGITLLTNGNYVIRSYFWDNGSIQNVGAVTFGDADIPLTGEVSAANSLIGGFANNQISNGNSGVTPLTNGNYVVGSSQAATFGNGITGITGIVSAANSLTGSAGDDFYLSRIVALANGNYVVVCPSWALNSTTSNAGAVTLGNGAVGTIGVISPSISLVGSGVNQLVGSGGITALPNGNYVVNSYLWNNARGAVTFGNGTTGITGTVSSSNSLVGSNNGDYVGYNGITILANSNFVVLSSSWNGLRGAATFVDGSVGLTGQVSVSNSLVGTHSSANPDYVGGKAVALPNGNYVVQSSNWNDAYGAATFGNGYTGISGELSSANSLVGSNFNDLVGQDIKVLQNGNYIVVSQNWNSEFGAITFCNGMTGVSSVLSDANSLVGTNMNNYVTSNNFVELSSGNYLMNNVGWNNTRGAVTFINRDTGVTGQLSASNSLIGSTPNDSIGSGGITVLTNGNYVVNSPNWDKSGIANAGAVTWGQGINGTSGIVSEANSFTGSVENDQVGFSFALNNGGYIIRCTTWNNGAISNAGAITLNNSNSPLYGSVYANNSVLGTTAFAGYYLTYAFDYSNKQLIVGRPIDNTVTLFKQTIVKSRKRIRFF